MKLIQILIAFLFPFIVVYICWAASLGAFDIHAAFKEDLFWGVACVYWIFFMWIPITIIVDDKTEEDDEWYENN